uniref:Uncharacterized protein n=1 Tax=Vespula pensylvanica TaxID=30213 RepID=A0A834U8P9_VESPE|nr:hypothetical protein H0235_009909 [Vespula pensylvanica]
METRIESTTYEVIVRARTISGQILCRPKSSLQKRLGSQKPFKPCARRHSPASHFRARYPREYDKWISICGPSRISIEMGQGQGTGKKMELRKRREGRSRGRNETLRSLNSKSYLNAIPLIQTCNGLQG